MQFNPVNPSVPALKWGREHEEIACDEYFAWADENHDSLTIRDSGLVINSAFPYLGAMPDGVITCNCFGVGLVEIKCPYKYKDVHPTALVALSDPGYCLIESSGVVTLSQNHTYYHQIQAQMNICDIHYCDFICWTTTTFFAKELQDSRIICHLIVNMEKFFKLYLMPELLTHKLQKSLQDKSLPPSSSKGEPASTASKKSAKLSKGKLA